MAAATMACPWATSASAPASNGVVNANTPATPRIAAPSAIRSSSEPTTASTPRSVRCRTEGASGRRTSARTWAPRASNPLTTAPPWPPVAPSTRTGASEVAFTGRSYRRGPAQRLILGAHCSVLDTFAPFPRLPAGKQALHLGQLLGEYIATGAGTARLQEPGKV